ncbi:MAG: peptidoglycan DD-metalloendopeptidase family protein [Thermodesulfobacteriota bacterium]
MWRPVFTTAIVGLLITLGGGGFAQAQDTRAGGTEIPAAEKVGAPYAPALPNETPPADQPSSVTQSSEGPERKALPGPVALSAVTEGKPGSTDSSAVNYSYDGSFADALVQMLLIPGATPPGLSRELPKLAVYRPRALIVPASPIERKAPQKTASTTQAAITKDLAVRPHASKAAFVPKKPVEPASPVENEWRNSPVGPISPLGPYDPEGVIATFQDPVQQAIMSSGFGGPRGNGPHLGTDLCGPVGTPVLAAGHGRVVYAGALPQFGDYGAIVVIDHGCGVYTLYGHVDPAKSLLQKRGPRSYVPAAVTAGTPIATIGTHKPGESSTGPHLHFEIMVIRREAKGVRYTFVNAAHYLPFGRKAIEARRSASPPKPLPGRTTISASPNRALWAVLNTLEYPVEVYCAQIEDTTRAWEARLVLGESAIATPDLLAGMAAIRMEAGCFDDTPFFVHASVCVARAKPFAPKKTPTKEQPRTSAPIMQPLHGHQTTIQIPSHLCPQTSCTTHNQRVKIYSDLPWVPFCY